MNYTIHHIEQRAYCLGRHTVWFIRGFTGHFEPIINNELP